jgi:hypothetical protein
LRVQLEKILIELKLKEKLKKELGKTREEIVAQQEARIAPDSPKPEVTIKLNKKIDVITQMSVGAHNKSTMLYVNKTEIPNTGSKISQINIEHVDKIKNCDNALNAYIEKLTSEKYFPSFKQKK